MPGFIKCFVEAIKIPDFKSLLDKHGVTEDMPEDQQREIGNKVAKEYYEKLNKDLNGLKKDLKVPQQKYIPPTGSDKAKEITEKYNKLIEEKKKDLVFEQIKGTPKVETPPPKPPEPPIAEANGDLGKLSGITHAETEKTREEFGLGEKHEKKVITDEEVNKEADETIKKGYNINTLLTQLEKGEAPSTVETAILKKYKAGIEAKIEKDPSDKNLNDLRRLVKATDAIGSEQGRAFRQRQGFELRDESLAGYFTAEQDVNKDAPLTDNQKEIVKNEWDKISEAKAKFEEHMAAKEAEFSKKQAETALNKTKSSTKAIVKKTHEDHVKYREQVIGDIRDKLKKARGETSATIIPYAKELFTIAPDVGKLVKDLLEEGIDKLDDVVKNIHGQLKGIIPDIQEKDVHNIIAGEYAEKKPARNDIAKRVFELKQQAQLINKYEKLEAGIEPVKEKDKIKRNQELEALRKQIKEHDLTKLSEVKSRSQSEISKLEEDLKTGNFLKEQPKKPELKLDKEAIALKDKLIKLRQERHLRLIKRDYENRSKYEKARDATLEVLNVPRTIMASMDYSAPLRQAIVVTIAHPITASKAGIEMFRQSVSEKRFDRWFSDLKESPRYNLMAESDLKVTDPHDYRLSAKEEAFMNNLAEKIPVIGRFIKGSERAYVGYLNKMRVDIFNRFADSFEEQGKTFDNSPELYKAMAHYVNNATGRGALGSLENYAPVLNTVFFSPRLIASRLNLINPVYYAKLPKEVRISALKDMGKFIGVGLTVLALAKLNNLEVEDDPRSTDFGKIKSGNTRWDIWGGFQQYIRVLTQMFLGQKKSTGTGEVTELNGTGRFGETRADVGLRFFRGKLAPIPSMGVDFLSGRQATGQETTIGSEAVNHMLPLLYSDVQQAMQDQGIKALFTVGIPSTFGVGVNTYTPTAASKKTFTIYNNRTKEERQATPEELKSVKDEQKRLLEDKIKKINRQPLGKNKFGHITIDEKEIVRKVEVRQLTSDQMDKFKEELGKQALRQAKSKILNKSSEVVEQ